LTKAIREGWLKEDVNNFNNREKKMAGKKTKSRKQVGLLLSKGSPLTTTQKSKLKRELKSGKVKVRNKK